MRLKELREEKGLSQTELAEKVETNQQNIGRWESGKNEPAYSYVVKLAEVLGVSVGYLVGSEDEDGATVVVKHVTDEPTGKEKELLKLFAVLPEDVKDQVIDYVKYHAEKYSKSARKKA